MPTKRPRDVNSLAKSIVDEATGERRNASNGPRRTPLGEGEFKTTAN